MRLPLEVRSINMYAADPGGAYSAKINVFMQYFIEDTEEEIKKGGNFTWERSFMIGDFERYDVRCAYRDQRGFFDISPQGSVSVSVNGNYVGYVEFV